MQGVREPRGNKAIFAAGRQKARFTRITGSTHWARHVWPQAGDCTTLPEPAMDSADGMGKHKRELKSGGG